jgi:tetratricopeptide (TPR) repeat protein
LIGQGKIYIGRAKETEAHNPEALRLGPRDTLAYIWMNMAALAKLHLGSYEQAVAWFRRSKEVNRNFNMAAALAHLGRLDEGHSAVQAGLALNPAYTVSRVRAAWTARSADPTFLAEIEPIFEGMRKAGLPE